MSYHCLFWDSASSMTSPASVILGELRGRTITTHEAAVAVPPCRDLRRGYSRLHCTCTSVTSERAAISEAPPPQHQETAGDMLMRCVAFLALVAGAVAFNGPSTRPALVQQRAASPVMQKVPKGWKRVPSRSRPGQFSFKNIKTGQVYDRIPTGGKAFYDDEVDTVSRKLWSFGGVDETEEIDMNEVGFYEGEDIATVGGVYYLAFVPFLLFFLSYIFGAHTLPRTEIFSLASFHAVCAPWSFRWHRLPVPGRRQLPLNPLEQRAGATCGRSALLLVSSLVSPLSNSHTVGDGGT